MPESVETEEKAERKQKHQLNKPLAIHHDQSQDAAFDSQSEDNDASHKQSAQRQGEKSPKDENIIGETTPSQNTASPNKAPGHGLNLEDRYQI